MIRGLGIALILLAGAANAQAPAPGTKLGTTLADVTSALEAEGYDLADVLQRHSLLRVTALRDGQRHEFRVTMRSGDVLSHKVLPKEQRTAAGIGKPQASPTIAAPLPANTGAAGDMTTRISNLLAAEGYQLVRAKREGGVIEAYAMRDNRMWEVYLDSETGRILKAELDD